LVRLQNKTLSPEPLPEDEEHTPEPDLIPEGPDPLTGWEQFAETRLERDDQAAAPPDFLWLRYTRWCADQGLAPLPASGLHGWLADRGAILITSVHGHSVAQGVRAVD
jgi:hypothetical protein